VSSLNASGKFPAVHGFMSQPERIALQRCVLETAHIVGDALEVGSLNGLSALLITSVLESNKTLICIEQGEIETLAENLVRYKHAEQVAIKREDFKTAKLLPNTILSFVFIDHSHTYAENVSAFRKFWPLISAEGILAFHDVGNPDFKDGEEAVRAILEQENLVPHLVAGGFLSIKRPPL
jgi:predicted O-methyltransferase YrrM